MLCTSRWSWDGRPRTPLTCQSARMKPCGLSSPHWRCGTCHAHCFHTVDNLPGCTAAWESLSSCTEKLVAEPTCFADALCGCGRPELGPGAPPSRAAHGRQHLPPPPCIWAPLRLARSVGLSRRAPMASGPLHFAIVQLRRPATAPMSRGTAHVHMSSGVHAWAQCRVNLSS